MSLNIKFIFDSCLEIKYLPKSGNVISCKSVNISMYKHFWTYCIYRIIWITCYLIQKYTALHKRKNFITSFWNMFIIQLQKINASIILKITCWSCKMKIWITQRMSETIKKWTNYLKQFYFHINYIYNKYVTKEIN